MNRISRWQLAGLTGNDLVLANGSTASPDNSARNAGAAYVFVFGS